MKEFPNRINELRRARGWSQERLGEAVGCSKVHISGLERGQRELNLTWMRLIARALGVSPADLLTEQDNPDRLSAEEAALLDTYRRSDPESQGFMRRVADVSRNFAHGPRAVNEAS